jgi:hypothetical protein
MPRGLRHVALSISFLSPIARRPDAFFATNIASLIFRPDLRFLALTSFQSLKRPSLSLGSSSRISLRKQSFSVSRPRLRPPGNIHNRSRLLLTNKTRPRFAATSLDDFAIFRPVPERIVGANSIPSVAQSKAMDHRNRPLISMRGFPTRILEVHQQRRFERRRAASGTSTSDILSVSRRVSKVLITDVTA